MYKRINNVSPYILLSCLFGVGLIHFSDATIRDDIADIKKEVKELEDENKKLEDEIFSQRNVIVGREIAVQNARENEKAWRQSVGASWTSQTDWEKAKERLAQAEGELKDANDHLQFLLNLKNDNTKRIMALKDEVKRLNALPPEPRPKSRLFAIALDTTCMVTDCLSYDEINLVFPDLGCPLKGKKCLDWHRQQGSSGYIINPDADVRERIPLVVIRSNFDEYHLDGVKGYDATNHTLIFGVGRYVNSGCTTAFIDSQRWLDLAGDSIMYLNSGCISSYKNTERLEHLNHTEHDITTSYDWQLKQWIKESKEKCINKCFEY